MPKNIRVPKVATSSAYDPDRPASTLLKAQVRVLQEAVLSAIHSEREASAQIETLTAALHQLRPQTMPVAHREQTKRHRKRHTGRQAAKGRSRRRRR